MAVGDQGFPFIGVSAFGGHAGELRVTATAMLTTLSGDTNGDGVADFLLKLTGAPVLVGESFIL